jgi:hypothetical protein
MALSKRLRFEILRRDNHACRYCGASAPDAELTVDHVVPVALGGSDEPSNLVAACKECNTGKSSSSPDAALVDDISADAFRWGQAIRAAAEIMLRDHFQNAEVQQQFLDAWNSWTYGFRNEHMPLPPGWRHSVDSLLAAGLPIEVLCECVDIAAPKTHVQMDVKFRYMCGIAWRKVGELRGIASTLVGTDEQQQSINPVTGEPIADPAHRTVEQALRDWQGRNG